VLAFLIAAGVAATHWPVLGARALSFDDGEYLTENPLVKNPSWESAGRFLSEVRAPSTVKGYYQPLAMISLMLDYAVAGSPDHLRPFHISSLMLHVLNSVLVMLLLYTLFGNPWAAALLGLLFGVHPMTVEPVAWIADRKTLVATFFALGCLILYVRYARGAAVPDEASATTRATRRSARYRGRGAHAHRRYMLLAACLLAYVLSLMAKPTGTMLPLALLLLDWWPLRRLGRRALLEKLPFVVVTAISIPITIISQSTAGEPTMPLEPQPLRVPLTLCHNIVFYLYKIFWPTNMSAHYPPPRPLDLSHPMVLAGVLGTVLLLALLLISLRRTRALLVGWLLFFVTIFPTLGVITFTNVVAADKFAYLPSVGLMLPLAVGLSRLWRGSPRKLRAVPTRYVLLVVVAILASVEVVKTRRCLGYWSDSERLFRYMVDTDPQAFPPRGRLGDVLREQGRMSEALVCYQQALRLEPRYIAGRVNLANALAALGRPDEAIPHYRLVIQNLEGLLNPSSTQRVIADDRWVGEFSAGEVEALSNLATVLATQDRIDEAITYYRHFLRFRPDAVEIQRQLDVVLARQREIENWIGVIQTAQGLQPEDADGHYKLANALRSQGRVLDATKLYQYVVHVKPDEARYRKSLAASFAKQGILDGAVLHTQQALRIDARDVEAHVSLAALFSQQHRAREAAEHYRQALTLRPDQLAIANNLAWLLATFEQASPTEIKEAVELAERAARQSNRKDVNVLDTLAAAYAAQARFAEAARTAREAIALAASAGKADLAEEIRGRLKLYEAKRAYREQ
jgi:tetratricopeptide (TPR) repeat protein